MAKLTDGNRGTISKAEPPAKGQRFIYDDHQNAPRGFGLRITSSGGKAFVLKYAVEGRVRLKTIGAWPTWSLEAARTQAREIVQQIDLGNDPLELKRRRKAELILEGVAEEWLAKHASGLKSYNTIRGLINNDLLPALGRKKITDICRRDVIELVEQKAETAPRSAAQLLIYAKKVLNYAADREYIQYNPAADLKPGSIKVAGQRDPLKPVSRERTLDHSEIRSFWAVSGSVNLRKLTVLCLKLVLVTGQRPGEVAKMHAREISDRWWTIPSINRGKTETEQLVYLTDTALTIIKEARAELERLHLRRKEPWSGYIFEGSRPGAPISSSALAKAVARNAAALENFPDMAGELWRPHDLRRTVRTGLSAENVRPDIAEIVLGHTIPGVRGVYDRHNYRDERREGLLAWERRLTTILKGQDPDAVVGDNVVRIAKVRA